MTEKKALQAVVSGSARKVVHLHNTLGGWQSAAQAENKQKSVTATRVLHVAVELQADV